LSTPLVRAACAVAAAEEPARALAAVLAACRECLGVPGAALLRAQGSRLVPLASDGLTVAERPLQGPHADGYLLRLGGQVEGLLVLAGATPLADTAHAALPPLLELAAAAVHNARLAHERADALAELAARVDALEQRAAKRVLGPELAASEERFRTLFESAACGILVRNAAGETTDVNEAARRIIGLPLAEMRGRTWSRAMAAATREDGTPFPEDERPLAIVLRTGRAVHGVTISLTRPDGEQRWIQVDSAPVFDRAGRLTQVVTSFIDVTERKRAQDAVQRSEARWKASYKGIPVPTYSWQRVDDDFVLVDYNDAAEQFTEGRIAAWRGRRARESYAAMPEIVANFERCCAEQTTITEELNYRLLTSGEERPMAVTYVFVPPDLVMVHAEDVTARREAERQRQAFAQVEKLRALGQMAGGVAHDLNQYLGLVAGHGELALRAVNQGTGGRESLVDSLNVIVQAAMDGAESVKRLLAFGRPRQDGPPVRIDVDDLLREVAKLTAPRWRDAAQAQGRPISLHIEAERDLAIDGWPESLREACTNLIFNAVDALPNGGSIRLAARRRDRRVEVEVTDTGVGMTAQVRARLFEPFFSTKGERGTGLGLPMVYGIVERHAGEIAVESTPGQGTTFRLSFPAAAPAAGAAPTAAPTAGVRPLRVLAVDDEPALARMAARMLAPDGHAVAVATSGEEAMERLAAEPFDLVISDVGMGAGMNGWELAEQVRARYPGVRVALATGWGAQIDPDEARARGIFAVLPKPYSIADMRRLATSEPS
jgi:PAS domain S-box-containing protein